MSHTRLGGVHCSTTELLLCNVFAGHCLNHLRTCQEHVRDALCHDGEVGQCGAINGTTGTRTEDCRDLGNDTRSEDVALEDFGITAQSIYTFLNTRTAGVVKADDGSSHLHCHIHNLADFLRHSFGKRACRNGEVLCKNINKATIDCTVTGNNAVAKIMLFVHTEVCTTVLNEHIEFFETTLIEELCYSLARCVFASGVLLLDSLFATAETSLLA